MGSVMEKEQVKTIIKQELPIIFKEDIEIRQLIVQLAEDRFADKTVTYDRFDKLLQELKTDREKQDMRWEEQNRKWYENQRDRDKKWEEQNKKWDENKRDQDKKWEEQNKKWYEFKRDQDKKWEENKREQDKKWEENKLEQDKKWEEQNRRWDESRKDTNEKFEKLDKRYNSTIGALGARWGIHSEESFRNGLKAILEESFDVEVIHVTEWDDEGVVFGRPDQVELDILIKNGLLIICELKSSVSKSEVYHFERKVRFYENMHNRKCARMIIISPMADDSAKTVAKTLSIEVYSYSDDIRV